MDYLDVFQLINNLLYSVFGLNEITLEIQVYINTNRSKFNITDKTEIILNDEDGGFVQWVTYNHTNLQAD